jgi:two-component system, chemotaxis family, sensor histidine kinase and response regulator WspE
MSDSLAGFSMFELFRAEAETHCAALSSGLLALETNSEDLSQVEALMRAAHSIKGAARIINLDAIVALAHAMEDCFVTVQQEKEQLTSGRVDQLLQGVDILEQVAKLAEDGVPEWLDGHAAEIQQLADAVRQPAPAAAPAATSVADTTLVAAADARTTSADADAAAVDVPATQQSGTEPTAGPPQPRSGPPDEGTAAAAETSTKSTSPTESTPTTETTESTASTAAAVAGAGPELDNRTVRVNAHNLNQIMRLSSESMIESQRIQSVGKALGGIQQTQRRLLAMLERLEPGRGGSLASGDDLEALRDLGRRSDELLERHLGRLERISWRSEELSTALYHEVIASRMRPFVEATTAFPRMVRDLARTLRKRVSLEVVGGSVPVDRDILRDLEAPLNHLLRNCVDHGIEMPDVRQAVGKPETGQIVLAARHLAGMLTVQVRDDGRGIDLEGLRRTIVERKLIDVSMAAELSAPELLEFLFLPGFSTASRVTEISGRGVGLDVVRTMVQKVSGTVRADSDPGHGTTFTLHLPVTLSVIRAALAEIGGELYAFPLAQLVRVLTVATDQVRPVQGRQQIVLDGQSIGLVSAAELLAQTPAPADQGNISVMVVGQQGGWCGLVVDRFVGEQDIVVRPLDPRLGKVPHISAAAVTETGDPLLIVDVEDLRQSMQQLLGEGRLRGMTSVGSAAALQRTRVLVVDDSITVREVERHLLVNHGYDVDVAVDGQDGWNALRAVSYNLLITDVDMPRMDGIELIRHVRQDTKLAELPIIVVSYKDREEDRLRGMEAGASAYLTKGSFHDDSLIQTVSDLVGKVAG